jgi:hypothetical protein
LSDNKCNSKDIASLLALALLQVNNYIIVIKFAKTFYLLGLREIRERSSQRLEEHVFV